MIIHKDSLKYQRAYVFTDLWLACEYPLATVLTVSPKPALPLPLPAVYDDRVFCRACKMPCKEPCAI